MHPEPSIKKKPGRESGWGGCLPRNSVGGSAMNIFAPPCAFLLQAQTTQVGGETGVAYYQTQPGPALVLTRNSELTWALPLSTLSSCGPIPPPAHHHYPD